MLLHANEDLSRWRQAKKRLRISASSSSSSTDADAELWVCVNEYPGNREPLNVRLNGRPASGPKTAGP